MKNRKRSQAIILLAFICSSNFLIGCGNDPQKDHLVQEYFETLTSRKEDRTATQLSDEELARVFETHSESAIKLTFIEDGSRYPLLEIADNNGLKTYAVGRITFTFKDGLLASTRGLGSDLMSSQNDQSALLVLSRTGGKSERIMRYLDGEGVIEERTFSCTISKSSGRPAIEAKYTPNVLEKCSDGKVHFENEYSVGQGGKVLASKQWHSELNGVLQFLQVKL